MLQLDNKTPYAADRTIVMDKNGAKSWVVAVKATFDLGPEGVRGLSDCQIPIQYSAEHFGKPGASSIRYEADLIPFKRATDVLLNGQAYAPAGKPIQVVDVTLRIDSLEKRLRIFGDRHWRLGLLGHLTPSSPKKFERIPIMFERAFGGWDRTNPDLSRQRLSPSNPIGCGFAINEQHLDGCALPNIEIPGSLISSCSDRPVPAGFGAISSHWSPRIDWAGTYDDEWMKRKFPLLPDDFDDRFFQCALPDQQIDGHLRGGEEVLLSNLNEFGQMSFRLPKIYLAFTTRFGKDKVDHRGALQTVIIEPDAARLIMVWQTSLACHARLDDLDTTVIREKRYV